MNEWINEPLCFAVPTQFTLDLPSCSAPALLQLFVEVRVCLLFHAGPLKKDSAPVADCFAFPRKTHVTVQLHLQEQRKFCRLPFALGCYTTKMEASRFHFPSPNRAVPCSSAPTSGIDKVATFPPCPTNGHHSCPELSAQWAWEGQGRTGGRKCSHLPLLVLYGGLGGTGTVVFPAQQVLTFISSDMNVQNCQGASTQLLSGVVPANTPPSPWPHRHPVCLSVPLPALLPLHTCAYIHMHAHRTLTQIKVFSHSRPKDGDCGFSCTSESCGVLPKATYDVNYAMTPSVTRMMSVQVFLCQRTGAGNILPETKSSQSARLAMRNFTAYYSGQSSIWIFHMEVRVMRRRRSAKIWCLSLGLRKANVVTVRKEVKVKFALRI